MMDHEVDGGAFVFRHDHQPFADDGIAEVPERGRGVRLQDHVRADGGIGPGGLQMGAVDLIGIGNIRFRYCTLV